MRFRSIVSKITGTFARQEAPLDKHSAEIAYWKWRHQTENGNLFNDHYRYFYTEYFGLTAADYAGKVVVDIGCGPRGSLEWAEGAARRIGVDPLVSQYRELGIEGHAMEYIDSGAESIPLVDASVDVVTTFNNLDHVDDVDAVIAEIKRITRQGGIALLITEVEHEATPTEPQSLSAEIARQFEPEFAILSERRVDIRSDHDVYKSVRDNAPYHQGQPGIVCAMFRRQG